MLVIASITRFETLSSRFFSPVFIFLLWSCSSWIIHRDKKKSSKRKWIIISGILLFIGFQYGQLEADYETWDGVKDAGIPGYTEDQWKYSPTVTFIEQNPFLFRKGFTVYANAYDAVYFFTGKKGKFLPHKESGTDIQQFLNDPHCYVIWFDDGEDPDLIGKSFLLQEKKMKLLKQFDDGSVYAFGE